MTLNTVSDDAWIERCVAFMTRLDPKLEPALAMPIAVDLCSRPRWRTMAPEQAAQALFDVGGKSSAASG